MTSKPVFVTPDDVRNLIAATFPEYRGKAIKVVAAESVTLYDLNWSGGTRSRYHGCTLDGRATGGAGAGNAAPPWANIYEGQNVPILPGLCLAEHSIFCGKDMGLTFYVHPSEMPRYLTSGGGDLSPTEGIVLKLIRMMKASYRREEAFRLGITVVMYEDTVESLKSKGLLNKSGALTLFGKNQAAGL